MKNIIKKLITNAFIKVNNLKSKVNMVVWNNSGEGFVDTAVFSVLRCYDRIATL